jgi:acyl-coenzyme A thioesterase PaaI-like protein
MITPGRTRDAIDRAAEDVGIHGLREIFLEAGGQATVAIVLVAEGGDGNSGDGAAGVGRSVADALDETVAVLLRHRDVAHEHGRLRTVENLHRLANGRRRVDLRSAVFEDESEDLSRVGFIFHEEHTHAFQVHAGASVLDARSTARGDERVYVLSGLARNNQAMGKCFPTLVYNRGAMGRTTKGLWVILGAGVAAALIVSGPAEAQNFRITYDVDRTSRPGQVAVKGNVVNDGPSDCFDVSVTAEALGSGGKVVASGVTYVDSRIGRGESRPFVALVPAAPAATRYRVEVSSFRAGFTFQTP